MNEERPESRQDERDSQLSAMFDGELPAAECELLARRLVRDEALRSQWSRYALIGAGLRRERGVKLDDRVARRVQTQVTLEVSYGDSAAADLAARPAAASSTATGSTSRAERLMRFARPVMGAGIAAGVAAMSILWLRTQSPLEPMVASNGASETITLTPAPVSTVALNGAPATNQTVAQRAGQGIGHSGEPERYTTPAPSSQTNIAPPARLANYVVAHSEYSGPLSRRLALLGLVASDGAGDVPIEFPNSDPSDGGTNNDAH
jgi:negative regulator of sigma E activity